MVISNMHNKFEQDTWIFFKFSCPQATVNADADATADVNADAYDTELQLQ